jgi:hypothetical protein
MRWRDGRWAEEDGGTELEWRHGDPRLLRVLFGTNTEYMPKLGVVKNAAPPWPSRMKVLDQFIGHTLRRFAWWKMPHSFEHQPAVGSRKYCSISSEEAGSSQRSAPP